MPKDDIVILCDPATLSGKTGSQLRSRTIKSGAVRHYIEVESTPLIHAFDPKSLGLPVAAAMAEALRQKMRGITATVSASTIATRARKAAAFAKGAPATVKRYSGGKMGAMAPNTSSRAFNDSGRMAQSIAVGAGSDDSWRINVAANRLDPQGAGGELAVRRIWNKLVSLVPEFGQPMLLFNDKTVQQGLRESLEGMIIVAEKRREQLSEAVARARVATVRQLLGFALQLVA